MLQKTTTLFVDMDGTLLDLHFDSFFWNYHLPKRFAEIHSIPPIKASTMIAEQMTMAKGTLHWCSSRYWSDTFDVDIIELKHEVKHLIGYRQGTREFLAAVKKFPVKLVLLTDADPHVIALKESVLHEAGHSLLQYMDKIVSSHELGYPKENDALWHALRRHLPFEQSTSCLIDDNLAVLRAAKNYGIGQLIAISQPDSTQQDQYMEGFKNINSLDELTGRF
jgi:putative hydrolase of the HAD superfamily